VFDSVRVNQDRPGPDPDRILVAQLTGTAGRHARWRELTAAEEAAAVAELRELAAGRADLLAEVAGVLQGASEGEPGEPLKRQAAQLCPGRPRPQSRREPPAVLRRPAPLNRSPGAARMP